jgi:hypothetical protein
MIYESISQQSFTTLGTRVYGITGVCDVYGFVLQTNTEDATLVVVADGTTRMRLHLKDDIKDGLKLNQGIGPDYVQNYESKRYSVSFPSSLTAESSFTILLQSDSGTKTLERGLVIREA